MGRPKKVKRAYHRKAVQQVDGNETPVEEKPCVEVEDIFLATDKEIPCLEEKEIEELTVELSNNHSELAKNLMNVVKKAEPMKKQNETFFNIEQGRIELEETERVKKETAKRQAEELIEKDRKDNSHKPKLVCPFCQNIQYSLNSKDVTSAWCGVCGRCFQAKWQ